MQPQEFLFKTYSIAVHHPFAEERLGGRYAAEILKLSANDASSLGKARVSAVCMVLCLSFRAATEAFLEMYGTATNSTDGLSKVMIAGTKMFDSIVEAKRGNACLPPYVDSSYFPKWRIRYEKQVLDTTSTPLKMAVLTTFLRQATFQYGDEPAIDTSQDLIMFFGDDVYDNYVSGFRNLLGHNVLQ